MSRLEAAWQSVYKSQPYEHCVGDPSPAAWFKDFETRLWTFAEFARAEGYAENILAMDADSLSPQVNMDTLVLGISVSLLQVAIEDDRQQVESMLNRLRERTAYGWNMLFYHSVPSAVHDPDWRSRTATCPTCGKQAPVRDGSLRCPDCNLRNDVLGKLLIDAAHGTGPLITGQYIVDPKRRDQFRTLKHWIEERFDEYSYASLQRVQNWLIVRHGMNGEETQVLPWDRLIVLLRDCELFGGNERKHQPKAADADLDAFHRLADQCLTKANAIIGFAKGTLVDYSHAELPLHFAAQLAERMNLLQTTAKEAGKALESEPTRLIAASNPTDAYQETIEYSARVLACCSSAHAWNGRQLKSDDDVRAMGEHPFTGESVASNWKQLQQEFASVQQADDQLFYRMRVQLAKAKTLTPRDTEWTEKADADRPDSCEGVGERPGGGKGLGHKLKPPRGFLGRAELAKALNIPEIRQEAFWRKLGRMRDEGKLTEGDEWQEIQNRAANSSTYQYRADSLIVSEIAMKYGQ